MFSTRTITETNESSQRGSVLSTVIYCTRTVLVLYVIYMIRDCFGTKVLVVRFRQHIGRRRCIEDHHERNSAMALLYSTRLYLLNVILLLYCTEKVWLEETPQY